MEIVVRATVMYWFLWLVVRGTGKRSISELTPLEMVLIVVLGDLVQQGVTQEDMSVTGAAVAVSVFVLWTLLSDALSRRSPTASSLIAGAPAIVLKGGEPLMDRLEDEHLSLEELKEAARLQGYRDLDQLEWAVLEADGQFSFVAKNQ